MSIVHTGNPFVDLLVGGIEVFSIIGGRLQLKGGFWVAINRLSGDFGMMGYFIIGIFVISWMVSTIIYKVQKYDEVEVESRETNPGS